jgi:glucosamine-6-phosphate deaminase
MEENLFKGIDLPRSSTHFPNPSHPEDYDQEIAEAGGIDIQLLGIGRDGHIGFNEPGTAADSKTHIIDLTESTIEANARFFHNDKSKVPTKAVSMGLGTIMKARHIILIANDPSKKEAIEHLLKKTFNPDWPATILSKHPNVDVFLNQRRLRRRSLPQGASL